MGKSKSASFTIFDPIYGFISLTKTEYDIIHSPFYQRLRWIRQLGFSSYIFHGAEHSRFGHSIGVMFNAHQILKSCGLAVPDEMLFDESQREESVQFHRALRLGALMHDLGTFPFSHTTEMAYVKRGGKKEDKSRRDDHEHLGSFIIKNTNYEGGITRILLDSQVDPQKISDLVKGVDKSELANQILHSEIDCDRMDYLLRDAHYTGLKYGSYDRDYLLYHFKVAYVEDRPILAIHANALHCIEDFLNARFAWYSQVVRSSRGAKYDALAERLTDFMLEKNLIFQYGDLLEMSGRDPLEFYKFNDHYFMNKLLELYTGGALNKSPDLKNMAYCLLFERPPKTIKCEEFKPRLLEQNDSNQMQKIIKKTEQKVAELQNILHKKGDANDWLVPDIPQKHVMFVKSHKNVIADRSGVNLLLERDPVKVVYDNGEVKLLSEIENSTISRLQNLFNYIPNVYCSTPFYELLKREKMVST